VVVAVDAETEVWPIAVEDGALVTLGFKPRPLPLRKAGVVEVVVVEMLGVVVAEMLEVDSDGAVEAKSKWRFFRKKLVTHFKQRTGADA